MSSITDFAFIHTVHKIYFDTVFVENSWYLHAHDAQYLCCRVLRYENVLRNLLASGVGQNKEMGKRVHISQSNVFIETQTWYS